MERFSYNFTKKLKPILITAAIIGLLAPFVFSQPATYVVEYLSELVGDVSISSPANNEVLTYNSTSGKWENAAAGAGSGDVTKVGDCASGDCFDGTSDGGTYLDFYDAQGRTRLIGGNTAAEVTLTLPIITGTFGILDDTKGNGDTGYVWSADKIFDQLALKSPLDSPTFTTKLTLDYATASELVATNASKELVSLAVATYPSLAELAYVKGVTSAIQTQIDAKAPSTSPTFATSIIGSYLTASELLGTGASQEIVSLPVATYPSLAELAYVKGLTSAVQTQIDGKQATLTNSAGLLGALDDETGTGLAVFNNTPSLTTPALNAPTLSNVKKRIYISCAAGVPRTTGGCADAALSETSTNKVNYYTCDFDASTDEHWQFHFTLPENYDASTFTYSVVWTCTADASKGVAWFMQLMSITDDDALDTAYGTAVESNDDGTATGDILFSPESAAVTASGSPAGGHELWGQLYRDVSDSDDDLTTDAKMLGIWLTFGIDALSTED